MNLSRLVQDDNASFGINETEHHQHQQSGDFTNFISLREVVGYASVVLGIPGNILSAIIWLRIHLASKNSSAIFLAMLAINDFAYLLFQCILYYTIGMIDSDGWLCQCVFVIILTTTDLEPLLVLGFSVERLIAIRWPFQVGLTYITYIPCAFWIHSALLYVCQIHVVCASIIHGLKGVKVKVTVAHCGTCLEQSACLSQSELV